MLRRQLPLLFFGSDLGRPDRPATKREAPIRGKKKALEDLSFWEAQQQITEWATKRDKASQEEVDKATHDFRMMQASAGGIGFNNPNPFNPLQQEQCRKVYGPGFRSIWPDGVARPDGASAATHEPNPQYAHMQQQDHPVWSHMDKWWSGATKSTGQGGGGDKRADPTEGYATRSAPSRPSTSGSAGEGTGLWRRLQTTAADVAARAAAAAQGQRELPLGKKDPLQGADRWRAPPR